MSTWLAFTPLVKIKRLRDLHICRVYLWEFLFLITLSIVGINTVQNNIYIRFLYNFRCIFTN